MAAAMTSTAFRRLALAFDGATEGEHMRHPDFRCGGRIFATLHPDGRRAMVRLTPAQQRRWLADATARDALEPASGAWGRQGCTMVDLAAVSRDAATLLLTDAWQNAVAAADKRAGKK